MGKRVEGEQDGSGADGDVVIGGDHQVEGGGPDRQAVLAAVAEAAEPMQVDGAHEAVAALALVEFGRGTFAELFVTDPVEGEEGALDAPHLPQRLDEATLARRRRQLSQHQRGADGAGPERGQKAQDVIPMAADQAGVEALAR